MNEKPLLWLRNGHINTIYTSQYRKVRHLPFTRERITTPDADFLDLDWTSCNSNKLVILSHGLEGSSRRPYIQGMVNKFHHAGFDTLAWNYRGCSDELNKTKLYYHSGSTYDLNSVIACALSKNKYDSIYLIGFSMGGNITLKFLGEQSASVNPIIKKAMAISTPIFLRDCSDQLKVGFSKIYARNFLKTLKQKVVAKKHLLPEINLKKVLNAQDLEQFDNLITAPLHGFADADDYYTKCSSKQNLTSITIPTLILSALDDPFLKNNCYPYEECKANPKLILSTPTHGGHNGFCINPKKNHYWSEYLAEKFILS